jgi:hypothetical protein
MPAWGGWPCPRWLDLSRVGPWGHPSWLRPGDHPMDSPSPHVRRAPGGVAGSREVAPGSRVRST